MGYIRRGVGLDPSSPWGGSDPPSAQNHRSLSALLLPVRPCPSLETRLARSGRGGGIDLQQAPAMQLTAGVSDRLLVAKPLDVLELDHRAQRCVFRTREKAPRNFVCQCSRGGGSQCHSAKKYSISFTTLSQGWSLWDPETINYKNEAGGKKIRSCPFGPGIFFNPQKATTHRGGGSKGATHPSTGSTRPPHFPLSRQVTNLKTILWP